jgi:enamine deaminase RidA (YjgF/YER057c/UK114 family)
MATVVPAPPVWTSNRTIQEDAVAQCEQALKNIATALKQADSSFADVVRVHYLMTNASDFERCWPAMGKAFGEVRPAATMMVVGLADARMKIEIEVTALRRKALPQEEGEASRQKRIHGTGRFPSSETVPSPIPDGQEKMSGITRS